MGSSRLVDGTKYLFTYTDSDRKELVRLHFGINGKATICGRISNLDDELETFRGKMKLDDTFKFDKSPMVTDDGKLVIIGSIIQSEPEESSKDK